MDENMQNYDMEAGAGADIPPKLSQRRKTFK